MTEPTSGVWPAGTTILAPDSTFMTVIEDGARFLAVTEAREVLEIFPSGEAPRLLATLIDSDDVRLVRAHTEAIALVGRRRESTFSVLRLRPDGMNVHLAQCRGVASATPVAGTARGLFVAAGELVLFSAPEFNERVELQASPTMLVPSHRGVVWLEWQSRVLFELRNDSLEARRLIDLPAQALDYSVRLEGNAAFFLQEEESWVRGPMAGEARQSLVTINLATGVARTLASGIHNARALHVTKNALLVEGEESVREPRSYALTSFSRLGHAPRKVLELPFWFSVVATTETHLFVRSLRRGIAKVPRNAG